MDSKKYDAILYIQQPCINEDGDPRVDAKKNPDASVKGLYNHANWDDPRMYNSFSFGSSLQTSLNNIGKGFSCDVTDFGKWVVVKISYHDIISGRTSSKTFLIVFDLNKNGIVLSTHNRYRSFSGVSQAISYIRSSISALEGSSKTKI